MFSNSSNKQLISSLSQTLTNSIDDLSNNFSSSLEDNSQLIQTNANNIASTLSQISYVVDAEGEKDGDTIVFATGMGAPMEDASGIVPALGLLVPTSGFLTKVFIAGKGYDINTPSPLTFEVKVYDASGVTDLSSIDIILNDSKAIVTTSMDLDPSGSQLIIKLKDTTDNSNNLVNWDDDSRFRVGFVIKPTDTFDGGASGGNQGPLNMASTEEAEYGFCVAYDNETIPDLSDGDIVPFNKASGLSDPSNNESAELFSYPTYVSNDSGGFDVSNSEYVVPVSGNYMVGWNAFVEKSQTTSIYFDFEDDAQFNIDQWSLLKTQMTNAGFDVNTDEQNQFAYRTRTYNSSLYPEIDLGGGWTSYPSNNGQFYGGSGTGSTSSHGMPGGHIAYKLPPFAGTVTVVVGDGGDGIVRVAILDKTVDNSDYQIVQYQGSNSLRETLTLNYQPEQYLYFASSENYITLYSILITPGYSQPSPFPVIRLEKNGLSLIEGGKDNAQNETRHIVNHLDKGDKLRLSVSGFFRLKGLKDTTFYGYLLNKDNAVLPTVVTASTNLSVKTLTTSGDATVGGYIRSQHVGFRATGNEVNQLGDFNGYIGNYTGKLPFKIINYNNDPDFYSSPSNAYSTSDQWFVVPVRGRYFIGFSSVTGGPEQTSAIFLKRIRGTTETTIIRVGGRTSLCEKLATITFLEVGDKIFLYGESTGLLFQEDHSQFFGYLMDPA